LDSQRQANGAGPSRRRRIPISYTHTKQTDLTYQYPNADPNVRGNKIRVTTEKRKDAKGEVYEHPVEMIVKENLGHLNVYSPRTAFDWRISINKERKVEGGLPHGVELRNERQKDRMTYIHQHCQVDLTQVTNPSEKEKSHELEVELRGIELLRAEAENAKNGKASKYAEMIRVFVDNVRLLARVEKI